MAMSDGPTVRLQGWMARLQAGDPTAFEELLADYEARLTRLARSMLRHSPVVRQKEQTGDVLQGALLRLDRALRKLAAEGRHESGLAFCEADFLRLASAEVRRSLLDMVRHYRGEVGRLQGQVAGVGEPAFDPSASPSWEPDHLGDWAAFHEAAATLPEKLREVFEMVWYRGTTQLEAAEALGVDIRTVRSRWLEARLRLRELLQGAMPEPGDKPVDRRRRGTGR